MIPACEPVHPLAGFAAQPSSGFAPLTVRFISTSSGADGFAWRFGDGGTSPSANPAHTFTAPGTYSVSFEARDSCTGLVNRADRSGYITVTPTAGTLVISSIPAGAMVFIDNVVKGITPVTLTDTAAGRHALLLTKEGFEDYTRTFTIEPFTPSTLGATLTRSVPEPTPRPLPAYGSIAITSFPSGATVNLDGSVTGTAPAVIPDLLPGNHGVLISLGGYDDWSQVVSVGSGQTTAVSAVLVATPVSTGSLAVTSDPPGAEIYIDDGFEGVSP